MTMITAIVAAAIPTAVYSLLIWWLDRYEKEPLHLIVAAFLWGSLPAIGLALVIESGLASSATQALLGPDRVAWSIAPLVEEPIKALALLGLFLFARREFDGALDGIVYGALVGFGFSMTENALYFARPAADLSASFWVRGVVFGMNHAFFTSMVGLAFSSARYDRTPWRAAAVCCGGLALAVLFHALHNFIVMRLQVAGMLVSWLIQSGGMLVILAVMVLSWRHERQRMERELRDEVLSGVLSEQDYEDVLSSIRRFRRQSEALLLGGWARYWRVRRLHHLATELAFCKSHLSQADHYHSCADRDHLREEILALRACLGRDAPVWGKP